MTIIERLIETIEKKNIKMNDLCKFLNIQSSTTSNWKKRNSDPPAKLIAPICEFLNVSIYWLLTGEEKKETNLKADEIEIITSWNMLTYEQKIRISERIEMYLSYNAENERNLKGIL